MSRKTPYDMKKVLLDTSIIIEFLRLKSLEKTPVMELVKRFQPCVSIITYFEAYAGKSVWEKLEARQAVEKLLVGMEVIELDTIIAEMAGKVRAHYNLSAMDSLIAATALNYNLQMVTINKKDFRLVPSLELIDLEKLADD